MAIKKKLFLASSSELRAEREQFERFISRKNNSWIDKGIYLELIIWENFLDAVSRTRLQDEYDKAIKDCDLFVMLFFTKVGKYTEEEFDTAYQHFEVAGKPVLFTYFKDAEISTQTVNRQDLQSLWAFQDKLKAIGHFYTVYKNTDDLLHQFNQQLDKLADSGIIELTTNQDTSVSPSLHQSHSGTGDNVAGNQTKIGRQINMGPNSTYHENSKD